MIREHPALPDEPIHEAPALARALRKLAATSRTILEMPERRARELGITESVSVP